MIKKIDIIITSRLNQIVNQYKILTIFFKLITHTSSGKVYILYAALIPLITIKGYDIVEYGLFAFAFQVPVYLLSKNIIKKRRPTIEHGIKQVIRPPDKYSFPSGHAASSTLFFLIINQNIPTIGIYFSIWMICIFLSRITLGLHYISDVVGGILLGILSFYITDIFFTYYF